MSSWFRRLVQEMVQEMVQEVVREVVQEVVQKVVQEQPAGSEREVGRDSRYGVRQQSATGAPPPACKRARKD